MKRTHVVIASEARQSSSTCRTLDCRVALILIDTQKRLPRIPEPVEGLPFFFVPRVEEEGKQPLGLPCSRSRQGFTGSGKRLLLIPKLNAPATINEMLATKH
jgi:hypothetical protein